MKLYLNQVWRQICSKNLRPEGDLVLAIDSPPEQDRTVAVVCDNYGRIELIGVREGTATTYDWVSGILERNKDIVKVVLADNNTLLRTGERLKFAGHLVNFYNTKLMHKAAARFWEAAHSDPRRVAILDNPIMTEANRRAFRWELAGGAWVFKRQEQTDFASPLIAATLAFDSAVRHGDYVFPDADNIDDLWNQATSDSAILDEEELDWKVD